MADVKGLVNDPEFQQLDPVAQKRVLGRLDPEIGQLPDDAFNRFKLRLTNAPQAPQTLPRTGNIQKPGEELRSVLSRVPDTLPAIGGTVANIPGAAGGAALSQGLKNLSPSTFGQPGGVGEAVVDTVAQGVVPQVVGNLLRYGAKGVVALVPGIDKLPAVKIAELINKAKNYMQPQSALMETAAENMRANLPNLSGPSLAAIPETSLNALHNVPYTQTEISATKLAPIAKDMLSDVSTVRNAKIATGNPTIVRQIAANDLVTRNYSKAADTIFPDKILDEIGQRPDVYEEAFGKPALDTFTELMQTAKDKGIGKTTDLASWREGRKALYLGMPARLLGIPFGVSETIVLGSDAMKVVATNPKLGQMILQATKTNMNAPEATLLQKAIVNGLRGTTLYIKRADGSKEKFETGTP